MRRSRVGLRDLPRVAVRGLVEVAHLFGGRHARIEGAHVVVRNAAGELLVVRTTYLGPGWTLPGGHVERGEPPHVAAAREAREETGLEVRVTDLLLVDARRRRTVSFVFAADLVGGELRPLAGEIAEAGFIAPSEIAATSPRLELLLSLLGEPGRPRYLGLDEEPGETNR